MATYDPPYDSPIEDLFAINAIKYLAKDCKLDKQVDVPTAFGTFRLDFVIEHGGQCVGATVGEPMSQR